MKIPDAYFDGGLGQKVPKLQAVSKADPVPGRMISSSAYRLGETIADAGLDEIHRRGMVELQEANERKAEQERLERLRAESEARSAMFAHQNELDSTVKKIAENQDLTPDQKRDEFMQQSDRIRGAFSAQVPEEYRYAFTPTFDNHHYSALRSLDTYIEKDIQDSIKAAGQTAREQLVNSARPLAEKLQILKDPDAFDWEAEGYSDTSKAAEIARMAEEATGAEIEDRLNSEDPRQVLTDLRAEQDGNYSNYGDLAPKTRQAYIRAARSAIAAQDAEAARRKKESDSEIDRLAKEAFKQYKNLREGLFAIQPKEEAAFWKTVAGTEYEAKAREVRKNTGSIGYVTDKVKEDPLKYGAAQMGLDVPPLSVDDPTSWAEQLAARGQVGGMIMREHGLNYIPVLTNEEAAGLAGMFKTQAPEAQVGTINMLQQGLGKQSVQKMASQIALKDPELGMVMGLTAAGRGEAAERVAEGRQLVETKAVQLSKATTDEMRSDFEKWMGGALTASPQLRRDYFNAVRFAYLSILSSREVPTDSFNDGTFSEALSLVVGQEPIEINDKKVMLPNGMTEYQFLDVFRRIDAERITSGGGITGYSSAEDVAEYIREDGQLYEAGDGQYWVLLDGKFLQKENGEKFVIDFTAPYGTPSF